MLPPEWVTASGRRLSQSGFGTAFSDAWANLNERFLKLECWQDYEEQESNRSQDAFKFGDLELATRLLALEAEADRPLYDDVRSRHLDYARVRLVQLPLTPYLEYELMSYRIRASMGENIEIVLIASDVALPGAAYFDFLLFDDRAALVHDYGTSGRQVGGWLVSEPATVQRLAAQIMRLRSRSMSLGSFLDHATTR